MDNAIVAVHSAQITGLEVRSGVSEPVLRGYRQNPHPEWRLDDEYEEDWSKFEGTVLNASYRVLATLLPLAAAPTFKRLTVLCLRETGVDAIELLRPCRTLVHLDLSSNEIADLVDGSFWACFPELLVVLLHGNKVMEWQAAGSLSTAPRLTYLTMFSNPICKRPMYRTFVTNSCESLRGLDLHAVSDEEVIDGLVFFEASRYRACSVGLAIPQPLFEGLTEATFSPIQEEFTESGNRLKGGKANAVVATRSRAFVLASISRRVGLLRKFHARNSPVIISQRRARILLRNNRCARAAVRIQACARKRILRQRVVDDLTSILKQNGELYLVQEMMTPAQVRTLIWFQRRIVGRFRLKVVANCAQTLHRFMGSMVKRFAAFVDCLERAQAGGVVVAADAAGELAAAVARASMIATAGLSWEEAAEQTAVMVTPVPGCKLIRRFSYIDIPDWPILNKDISTDGVFITRSARGGGRVCTDLSQEALVSSGEALPGLVRSLSDHRGCRTRSCLRMGIYGDQRVRECLISRRGSFVQRTCRRSPAMERNALPTGALRSHEQLWVFRTENTRMLARVLCTLRHSPPGKRPVLCLLERHLFRCAAATRIQAAWRGHVLRWNLLETLASCLIVGRAGICIQRWWRNMTGFRARLRLGRRLWALASTVICPIMYMELDVYCTLVRGWQQSKGEGGVAFVFQDGLRVASINYPPSHPYGTEAASFGRAKLEGHPCGGPSAGGVAETPGIRKFPVWVRHRVVPHISPLEVEGPIVRQIRALLTEGVQVKRVVWPVVAATTDREEKRSVSDNLCEAIVDRTFNHLATSSKFTSGGSSEDNGSPVDFESHHGEVEMLELTFSSTQEARARALLVVLATEECGVLPNRPVAQLMTLGMLRRAAAGEPGQASPILSVPAKGYDKGDSVEISVLRLFEGRCGSWFPGTVDQKIGNGTAYKVTLDNGWVEPQVPHTCLRPYDRTGKETALVEMSHLPSRWRQEARSRLTPDDRLEMELLHRSLAPTAEHGEVRSLLREDKYRHERLLTLSPCADISSSGGIAVDELGRFNGLSGRVLLRPESPVARMETSLVPRWAGSYTISTARNAEGLAAEALEKVARVAAAADEAVATRTWVPGNRFKRNLEKLVHLAAFESQNAAEDRELTARREAVVRTKIVEHAEPTPRDRLERLKAAEVAIFRREADERRCKAALDNALDRANRVANAAEAKECMRDSKELTDSCAKARRIRQIAESKQREDEVKHEHDVSLEKRNVDVQIAKARAFERRASREKQALCRAESNTFTANASQIARHVGKYSTISSKANAIGNKRRWVKGQQVHKEEMRRRMLKRVEELQETKRNERNRQRRTLAARARARAIMDEAVLSHRLGQPNLSGNDVFTDEVMQVLRPSSRLDCQLHSPGSREEDGAKDSGGFGSWRGEGGFRVGDKYHQNTGESNFCLAQQRPSTSGSVIERGRQSSFRFARNAHDTAFTTSPAAGAEKFPSKPDGPQPRSHHKKNRRLQVNGDGKTVVVFASVPTVATETRSKLLNPKSSHSILSSPLRRGQGGDGHPQIASPVPSDSTRLPWPLGRRCW